MPKPVYIICAEGGSEDRITGRTSLYNLAESIVIQKLPDPIKGIQVVMPMFVSAAWMRTEDEANKEFESELLIHVPQNNEAKTVARSEFIFAKPFQRFSLRFHTPLPFTGPGMMYVINRIRAVGSKEWISQEYPVVVEEIPMPQPPQPSSEGATQTTA